MDSPHLLPELSQEAQKIYPNSDPAVAVLARFSPDVLQPALKEVIKYDARTGLKADAAEENYQQESANPNSADFYKSARESLEADQRRAELDDTIQLARGIYSTRDRLAKPMKRAAVLLSVLAIGGAPAGYFSYEAATAPHQTETEKIARTTEAIKAATFGLGGVIIGLFTGTLAGLKLTNGEAGRRARRIVKEQNKLAQ